MGMREYIPMAIWWSVFAFIALACYFGMAEEVESRAARLFASIGTGLFMAMIYGTLMALAAMDWLRVHP